MAVNLLTYLTDQFTPAVVNQLSSNLGETPANTLRAVTGAIPTLLGGLTHRAHNTTEAASLIDLLRDGNYGSASLDISQVTNSRSETTAAVGTGSNFVERVLGDKTDRVAAEIARFSGVARPSALAVLDLAGSALMGVLGRQVLENGLTADNLTTLLAGQAAEFKAGLPAGLSAVGTMLGIDKFHIATPSEHGQPIDSYSGTSINPNIPKSPEVERERENNRWLRPAIYLIGALVLFLIVQKCREPQTASDGIYTDTTARAESDAVEDSSAATATNIRESNASTQDTAAGPFARGAASAANPDSMASATETADIDSDKPEVRTQIELPGGRRLKLTENSFTYNLAKFLAGKPKNPERTFTFDNLTFERNSARITAQSRESVNELIEIMRAYPGLAIRVEGHTDNTGNAADNQKLSAERATAVKAALVTANILSSRIATQGFGASKPTASNNTPDGQQKNRRIDVAVTKL